MTIWCEFGFFTGYVCCRTNKERLYHTIDEWKKICAGELPFRFNICTFEEARKMTSFRNPAQPKEGEIPKFPKAYAPICMPASLNLPYYPGERPWQHEVVIDSDCDEVPPEFVKQVRFEEMDVDEYAMEINERLELCEQEWCEVPDEDPEEIIQPSMSAATLHPALVGWQDDPWHTGMLDDPWKCIRRTGNLAENLLEISRKKEKEEQIHTLPALKKKKKAQQMTVTFLKTSSHKEEKAKEKEVDTNPWKVKRTTNSSVVKRRRVKLQSENGQRSETDQQQSKGAELPWTLKRVDTGNKNEERWKVIMNSSETEKKDAKPRPLLYELWPLPMKKDSPSEDRKARVVSRGTKTRNPQTEEAGTQPDTFVVSSDDLENTLSRLVEGITVSVVGH